jgi:hypothetical protein
LFDPLIDLKYLKKSPYQRVNICKAPTAQLELVDTIQSQHFVRYWYIHIMKSLSNYSSVNDFLNTIDTFILDCDGILIHNLIQKVFCGVDKIPFPMRKKLSKWFEN